MPEKRDGNRLTEAEDELQAVEKSLSEIDLDSAYKKASEDIYNSLKAERGGKGSMLLESYNEVDRSGKKFEVDTSNMDSKRAEIYKRYTDSGILNNTNRTHDFVDMLVALEADRGIKIDVSNNQRLAESGFSVEGATVNGVKTADRLILNLQSAKALNKVLGHEVTHVLEGSEAYSELEKLILEYGKGEIEARTAELKKLYKTDDVQSELVADMAGDYLFSDERFIKSLAQNKNLFQRIFDEIKYLLKIAGKGTKQEKEFARLKRAFEKALSESKNESNKTEFSLSEGDNSLSSYNEELTRFIEQRGDYIVDSAENLRRVVNLAYDNPKLKATAYFGIISTETLEKIKNSIPNLPEASKEILFKKGKDYSIATTFDAIRHISDDKNLSREDVINYLGRLTDTILKFDSVAFDYYYQAGNKMPGILFKKKFLEGTFASFNIVSHKKRSIVLHSLYLNKSDYKKRKVAKTLLMQNAPAHTPKARVGQPSVNSIAPFSKNVKENEKFSLSENAKNVKQKQFENDDLAPLREDLNTDGVKYSLTKAELEEEQRKLDDELYRLDIMLENGDISLDEHDRRKQEMSDEYDSLEDQIRNVVDVTENARRYTRKNAKAILKEILRGRRVEFKTWLALVDGIYKGMNDAKTLDEKRIFAEEYTKELNARLDNWRKWVYNIVNVVNARSEYFWSVN